MLQVLIRMPFLIAALIAFMAWPALARDDIRTEQVHFKPGASSATIKGKIKVYEGVDYVLEASKGQQMNVSMATDNGANYFNILPPGENEVAMFVGSTSGNQFEGTLPKSGAYKIRVYMMRSAARREEVANFRLEMIVTGALQKAGASASGIFVLYPGVGSSARAYWLSAMNWKIVAVSSRLSAFIGVLYHKFVATLDD